MSHPNQDPPIYVQDRRTMRISGKTIPKRAAQSAYMLITKDNLMPDFFYIGGNAGQQAMKAMSTLRYKFALSNPDLTLTFVPVRVLCEIKENDMKVKDAVVWRAVILNQPDNEITNFS